MIQLPEPYYQEHGITIYCGDCRDILPLLPKVDLLLTDPPYGVGFKYDLHQDSIGQWKALMTWLIPVARSMTAMAIMPSCQIKELQWIYANIPPDWLICWYKGSPGHSSFVGFNDWEPLLVYGKPKGLSMHDYFYAQPQVVNGSGHPCPKPLKWATWLISKCTKPGSVILDPFMGSGTTLRAAKDLGREAIGVDISSAYCEIAVERLRQGVMAL